MLQLLYPWRKSSYPSDERLGDLQSLDTLDKEKKNLALLGTEPSTSGLLPIATLTKPSQL
jgi:hypothetical protein